LNGQAGRRIEVRRSGVEDIRRRVVAGLWVALLLAILSFLVSATFCYLSGRGAIT
jgi:hypothetical protein